MISKWPQAARARATELCERFDLSLWPQLSSAREFRENLFLLDFLDRCLPPDIPPGPAIDVGAKNGSTLPALWAAAPRPWDAIELDPHRRYFNLATRRAHGEAMARVFPGCRYLCGSVLDLDGRYALITWILPFLFPEPLKAWGLPRRFFAPEKLLGHVLELLAPRGALLIVNQGEDEAEEQERLLRDLPTSSKPLGSLPADLSPFHRTRFGFLVRRV